MQTSSTFRTSGATKRSLPISFSWKIGAAFVWLATTITLSAWWLIFGLRQVDLISHLQNSETNLILRQHRMLIFEGSFLFALLVAGGIALFYTISIEMRRSIQVQTFFAAFTHDLKTSLASLRLQAEALEEDLKDSAHSKLLRRLVKDSVRLELQLENSLFIANPETTNLFFETVSLRLAVTSLQQHWPELTVTVNEDATIEIDRRAFESILKNLLQNAFVHGHAKNVVIAVEPVDARHIHLRVSDDGRGFQGNSKRIADAFYRHGNSSGSGMGLHLSRVLARRMGGNLTFETPDKGFAARLRVRGAK